MKFIKKYFMVNGVEGFFQVNEDSTACKQALVHISLNGLSNVNIITWCVAYALQKPYCNGFNMSCFSLKFFIRLYFDSKDIGG